MPAKKNPERCAKIWKVLRGDPSIETRLRRIPTRITPPSTELLTEPVRILEELRVVSWPEIVQDSAEFAEEMVRRDHWVQVGQGYARLGRLYSRVSLCSKRG